MVPYRPASPLNPFEDIASPCKDQSRARTGQLPRRQLDSIIRFMRKRSSTKSVEVQPGVETTGEQPLAEAATVPEREKNPAAVALGRLGGKKGGLARAKKLTKEQRQEIARKAAQ